jgi:hypothetical protein
MVGEDFLSALTALGAPAAWSVVRAQQADALMAQLFTVSTPRANCVGPSHSTHPHFFNQPPPFSTALRSDFEEWVGPLQAMLPHMAPEMRRLNKTAAVKRQRSAGGASATAICTATAPDPGVGAAACDAPDADHNKKQRPSDAQPFSTEAITT